MSGRHALLVATTNVGKVAELRALLADLPVDLLELRQVFRAPPVVVEDGATFAANALKKAQAYAAQCLMLTLADDSGLEVDALGGAPGVRSARFAHERATDAENRSALLAALEALGEADPLSLRSGGPTERAEAGFPARFRCSLALVDPLGGGAPLTAEGTSEGTIIATGRGAGGFGYDPLFLVAGRDRTMAELAPEEKNALSHRGRAVLALKPQLAALLSARDHELARIVR